MSIRKLPNKEMYRVRLGDIVHDVASRELAMKLTKKDTMPARNKRNFRATSKGAGMTKEGVRAYRRLNPGSHLKTAVTSAHVKPGSEAAKRRKSYCARSAGQLKQWPAAARDPNSRLRQARRRWRCNSPTKKTRGNLHEWFAGNKSKDGVSGWVQVGGTHDGGHCARYKDQTGPVKCVDSKRYRSMTKTQKATALRRKRHFDPNQGTKRGKATNVPTMKKDACYYKVKARYKVWPSAYASGALVKCRRGEILNGRSKRKRESS